MTQNEKVDIIYRAEKRNKLKLIKVKKDLTNPITIANTFNPHTKEEREQFKIMVAIILLNNGRAISDVKKMSGLTIRRMLRLQIIEWYYPFTKVVNDKTVPDESIQWLRFNKKVLNG